MLRNRTTYINVLNYHYRLIRPFFISTTKDIISCSYCDIHSANTILFLKFTNNNNNKNNNNNNNSSDNNIAILLTIIIILIIRRRNEEVLRTRIKNNKRKKRRKEKLNNIFSYCSYKSLSLLRKLNNNNNINIGYYSNNNNNITACTVFGYPWNSSHVAESAVFLSCRK